MKHKSSTARLILALGAVALAVFVLVAGSATNSKAATAPGLGTAASYAVLAGSTVTNTGTSTINGDVGVSPGSAVTGFPPGIVTGGTIHTADANAGQAQSDVTTTYNALAGQPCDVDLTGQDLGGMTLTEGVYCFTTSAQLTGQLTLNAQGNASAVFIFQIGSTLTTASNASILITNGGVDCNAFWQVGSSATLGTTTDFVGNVLALTSITLNTGASVSGRVLARNGAVTLDTNDINFLACAAVVTDSPTPAPTDTPAPTATTAPTDAATPTDTAAPTATATTTGSPPLTPVEQTPTPTATATATTTGQAPTSTPSSTPVAPTLTPTPVGETPTPTTVGDTTLTSTPTPVSPTATLGGRLPPPAPTNTPSPTTPLVPGFPNTGGPPAPEGLPWTLMLLALALSSTGVATLILARRRAN